MSDSNPNQRSGDTEAGFLDVAANALAVMILATMMLLVVAAPIRIVGETEPDSSTPEVTFPVRSDPTSRPLYDYFLASDAGIAAIDLDAIALATARAAGDSETEQGKVGIVVARTSRRDWNDYLANFSPDYSVLKAQSQAMDEFQVERLVSQLVERYEAERVSPTFFVLAEAIEIVAPVYWGLRLKGIPVRWYPTKYGASIEFERSAHIFELPGALD